MVLQDLCVLNPVDNHNGLIPVGLSRLFHLHCSLVIYKVVCASHPCSSLSGLHSPWGGVVLDAGAQDWLKGFCHLLCPAVGLVALAECGTGMWPEQFPEPRLTAAQPLTHCVHPSPAGLSSDRDLPPWHCLGTRVSRTSL